jgi:hypothetical protein
LKLLAVDDSAIHRKTGRAIDEVQRSYCVKRCHSCSGSSDSIILSASKNTVPEPGTFILLGSGLLGSGMLKYYPAALWRRLFNRRK